MAVLRDRVRRLSIVCGGSWRVLFALLVVAAIPWSATRADQTQFPNRPITIIVYTGPGGLIDTTARQFIEVARNHTHASFYVRNIPEGKGIAAMKRVLDAPADGYTLYAATRSNIAKAIASEKTYYLTSLDWIALLMSDPECVITRRDGPLSRWEGVVRDAKERPGQQVWLGPDTGGLDHVLALRTWEKFGIQARWVPFKSGGEALTNLLGGQGDVYVGNPLDAIGMDPLRVALVSRATRMAEFPDTPTYGEFGAPELDQEVMWRGFAVKMGTPPAALDWYEKLFRDVSEDPQWRELWEPGGIDVGYRGRDEFRPMVEEDIEVFTHYLQRLGLVQTEQTDTFSRGFRRYGLWWAAGLLLIVNGLPTLAAARRRRAGASRPVGELLIPLNILCVAMIFLAASFTLVNTAGIGPAVVPRIWIGALVPCCVVLILQWRTSEQLQRRTASGDFLKLIRFVVWLFIYLGLLVVAGYYVATLVFLVAAMLLLGMRDVRKLAIYSIAWLATSYLVFERLLNVALPVGQLWDFLRN